MTSSKVNGVNGVPQVNGISHETNGNPRSRNPNSYAAKFKVADHFIGGNHLDVAPPGSVKDFVLDNDGHTVITNVTLPVPLFARLCPTDRFPRF